MNGKLELRQMYPWHLPAVRALCREQNERDGTSYGVPDVFDADGQQLARVPLALVTVDGSGMVHSGHVFEQTVEYMGFGGGARAIGVSIADSPAVFHVLRAKGYRDLHIQVPRHHASRLEKALAKRMGMVRDDDRLAHFYRDL